MAREGGEDREAVGAARAGQLPAGTTMLVVRNIPAHYTHEELLRELELGSSFCDYFSLPLSDHHPGNMGLAFVHFTQPHRAVAFTRRWHGQFLSRHSEKAQRRLNVAPAQRRSMLQNAARLLRPNYAQFGTGEPVCSEEDAQAAAEALALGFPRSWRVYHLEL
mmetsp:Transcript_5782/g.13607  ORF Transcript_5782/g.13607 Transcript_5782/m.13607 type:complete len:163 (-) Transcript_5782:221-709(-)